MTGRMPPAEREKLKARLARLEALAADVRGNANEREVASKKAEEIRTRLRLEAPTKKAKPRRGSAVHAVPEREDAVRAFECEDTKLWPFRLLDALASAAGTQALWDRGHAFVYYPSVLAENGFSQKEGDNPRAVIESFWQLFDQIAKLGRKSDTKPWEIAIEIIIEGVEEGATLAMRDT